MARALRGFSWKRFLKDVVREYDQDRIGETAGALAFSGVLALFPFVLFCVALAAYVIDPKTTAELVSSVRRLVPPEVATLVVDRIVALTSGPSPTLLTLGGIGAIWAAAGGIVSMMSGLNVAYGIPETRSFWRVRAIALVATLAGAVLGVAASSIAVAVPALAKHLGPLGTALLWLRVPVASALVFVIVMALYYVLPNERLALRKLVPGAIFSVVVWLAASLGFSAYVSSFGRYEVSYGALGGVIVLLVWMWISSLVVLVGAEINAVLASYARSAETSAADKRKTPPADVATSPHTEPEREPAAVPVLVDRSPAARPVVVRAPPRSFPALGLFALLVGFFLGRRGSR